MAPAGKLLTVSTNVVEVRDQVKDWRLFTETFLIKSYQKLALLHSCFFKFYLHPFTFLYDLCT
jgi:hypothetical protein